nr:cytochrome c biogenesis Fn [Prionium serratum]
MSLHEFSHYSLFPGLFLAFTYNKKEGPAFGAAPSFFCILLPFLGLLFCHLPNNLSNYNVLTANAPFFFQISGTWSNHEGSILSWCWIPSLYGFLLSYRGRSQSHHLSKGRGYRETCLFSFVSNFVKNYILSLQKKGGAGFFDTPFLPDALVDSSLPSKSKPPFHGTALLNGSLDPQMSFPLLAHGNYRPDREGKRTILQMARDQKDRAQSIDEEPIDGPLGIALFFSTFLSASSDPFVRNFFLRTEPLAESNPVPQDPISAIHPPRIYAGAVASAIGFALARYKMINAILALHYPTMRKHAQQKNARLLTSAACLGSHIRSSQNNPSFKIFGREKHTLLFLQKRSILILKRRKAFSDLCTGELRHTGRELQKPSLPKRMKEKKTYTLSWTEGANTLLSKENNLLSLRIWILTCRVFLTVGISPGSWWAHHELGWGGWWFRDPVENASLMPRILATARLHSAITPLLLSWTYLLHLLTFTCCVSGTFAIRSGLLAPVHSSANDLTRGRFLLCFLLILTTFSFLLLLQIKTQAYKIRSHTHLMLHARKTLLHLKKHTTTKGKKT